MEKTFDYFMIYGTVENLPLAVIHKDNVPEREKAEEMAKEILAPRGISDIKLLDRSEKEINSKIGAFSVDFLYDESTYITLENASGNGPSLVIYPNTNPDKKTKGVGFTFMDDKVLDEFMRKTLEMYLIYKKRIAR